MTLHRARPPRPTPVPPVRRLASIGAAAALGLSLSACSGSPGTSAPSDASEDDFCEAYSSLQERVFEDLDLGATEEEQAQKVADAVRAWAEDLAAAGTPEGIPDEAREGYEVFVDAVQDLPDDVTTADLDDLERDLSEDEQAAAEDFTSYAEDLCPSTFPTDLRLVSSTTSRTSCRATSPASCSRTCPRTSRTTSCPATSRASCSRTCPRTSRPTSCPATSPPSCSRTARAAERPLRQEPAARAG